MKRSQAGWLFLCFLSTFTLAFSQTATTSLRGVIKDPSGALVAGWQDALAFDGARGTTGCTAGISGQRLADTIGKRDVCKEVTRRPGQCGAIRSSLGKYVR